MAWKIPRKPIREGRWTSRNPVENAWKALGKLESREGFLHGGEEFLERRAVRVHRNDLLGW